MKILFSLMLLWIPSSSFAVSIDDFKATLLSHSRWLSISFEKNYATPQLKSWSARQSPNDLILREDAETSFEAAQGNPVVVKAIQREISISEKMDPSVFSTNFTEAAAESSFAIEKLPKEVYKLTFPGGTPIVFFKPLGSARRISRPDIDKYGYLGVWRAPLGPSERGFDLVKKMGFEVVYQGPKPSNYIHQNLSQPRQVIFDSSFPPEYIPNVMEAMHVWNRRLPSPAFSTQYKIASVDEYNCYLEKVLCFFWSGPRSLAWTGWGGINKMSFDPVTGEVIGATIVIENHLTDDEADRLSSDSLPPPTTIEGAASMVMHRSYFKSVLHPFPKRLVAALSLHELGHSLGFSHDFTGSIVGTAMTPSTTVMTYLPFPVWHRMLELGEKDIERIKMVYGNQSESPELRNCDDSETIPGWSAKKILTGWNPYCNQYTLGNPMEWYKHLSGHGNEEILSEIPFPFQLPLPYLSKIKNSIILRLAGFLVDERISNSGDLSIVKSIVCNSPKSSDAEKYLHENFDYFLTCK